MDFSWLCQFFFLTLIANEKVKTLIVQHQRRAKKWRQRNTLEYYTAFKNDV